MKKCANTQIARIMPACYPALDAGSKSVDVFFNTTLQLYSRIKNLPTTSIKLQANKGFTLVELAIVIVIIGLLVGGVLQGKSLIEAAERQKVVKEYSEVVSAYNLFKSKYNCVAGDCVYATRYFDSAACDTLFSPCDSSYAESGGDGIFNNWRELHRFWVHLHMANMIMLNDKGNHAHRKSAAKNRGMLVFNGVWGGVYNFPAHNYYFLSNDSTPGEYRSAFNPETTMFIDKKLDDEKPSTGIMVSVLGTANLGTCVTGTDYNIANSGISCVSSFKLE